MLQHRCSSEAQTWRHIWPTSNLHRTYTTASYHQLIAGTERKTSATTDLRSAAVSRPPPRWSNPCHVERRSNSWGRHWLAGSHAVAVGHPPSWPLFASGKQRLARPIRNQYAANKKPVHGQLETSMRPIREPVRGQQEKPVHGQLETSMRPIRNQYAANKRTSTRPIRETSTRPTRETSTRPIRKQYTDEQINVVSM